MQDSYLMYKAHLKSHMENLQRGTGLTDTSCGGWSNEKHGLHKHAHSAQATMQLGGEAVDPAGALLQWLAIVLLCLLVYCWRHSSDPHWGIHPAAARWLAALDLPRQPFL